MSSLFLGLAATEEDGEIGLAVQAQGDAAELGVCVQQVFQS